MNIDSITSLKIKEIKIISYVPFIDSRGYFMELFRKSDMEKSDLALSSSFVQINESFSLKYTLRGLHFQWNPYMGKLVRVIDGWMIDLVLDIRKSSKTFGKIIAYSMKNSVKNNKKEWIWIPPGFAHGNFFIENTIIEYLCTGEYNPKTESGISPLAEDIDWSLCDRDLRLLLNFDKYETIHISNKDRHGNTLLQWKNNGNSNYFI